MAFQLARRRFTVADFEQMVQSGILMEDDRVELIAGEIVEMAAIGQRHAGCINRLTRLLVQLFSNGAVVAGQNPLIIGDEHAPQPDIMVLQPRADDYAHHHPIPADVLLLIEVADSSIRFDRRVKLPLYATAGISEVWLVDLNAGRVERHTEPADGGYRIVRRFRRGQRVASITLPQLVLAVDTILID